MNGAMKISDFGVSSGEVRMGNCDHHGSFDSRNVFGRVWSKCPACVSEQNAIERAEMAEKEAKQRTDAWERRVGMAGIPERFKSRTLASYQADSSEQKKALEFAKGYAESFGDSLKSGRSAIFCGIPGTGKTHLAVGIALAVMAKNRTAAFTTVQRLVRRVKDSWRNGADESEGQIIALFVDVDLLILDEIGVQFGTEFEKNLLFDVINERYENSRPTLLLSNLDVDGVKRFLGERVFDRLREGGGKAIAFTWKSYRGAA